MPLSSGTRLGPYEIVAPLGAGGMGEVYRAKDPRLGRDVAVKVLPRAVAGDPERLMRFETEARAAGALNHPSIVTLHNVGADGGAPYLVTELLEGENLRALILRGPVPSKRAVQIVVQVANGLAAAHSKGIVHRDLKPENLFLLPDGRVKILDFGIAKLTSGAASALAETTPVFASLTAAGTIMGTVSYMAPEQLRDLPVDHRADLFALGAILHELLTGTPPFQGDTAADRVSAILTAEPPPLPPEVERDVPGIGEVIARLLVKRPEGRLESAGDLAFTLELLACRPTAAGGVEPLPGSTDSSAGPGVRFRPLTFRDGQVYCARFAPDGQTFVYQAAFAGGQTEIFLARVESPDARSLGLGNADLQAVSSTAELAVTIRPRDIGGFVRLGTLARVPLVGGRPRELVDDVYHADWSPDGRSLAAIRRVGATFQVEAPIGTVIHKTNGWLSRLRYSPDGKQIAVLEHPTPGSNAGFVSVIRPGEPLRRLTEPMPTIWNLTWRPDGGEIWFGAQGEQGPDGVYAVTLAGTVRHVYSAPGFAVVEDIAASGDALFTMVSPRMRMETSSRSGGRSAAVDLSWLDWSLLRDMSPDGSMVLFDESGIGSGGVPGVYIRSTDGEPAVRLGDGICSAISDDGRFVLAGALDSKYLTVMPTGAGELRRIPTGDLSLFYADWLPGDREVILVAAPEGHGRRLYRMEIESGAIRPLHDQVIGHNLILVSPDGTRVIARGGDGALALFPVDGAAARSFPELDSMWRAAGWTADSRSFFAFRGGAVPAPVFCVDAAIGTMEPWMEVLPIERSGVSSINTMRVTPDGERYVCSYARMASALFHARGLR